MAAWMADDGLAGCCGNVMLPAGGGATVVGGAAITWPGSVLLNALKQAVTKQFTFINQCIIMAEIHKFIVTQRIAIW